ncbi:signal recognition particle-docking protein FtsY [Candidatus Woesearchaeota archaeon]|nr:signal recognition particle-docking protein FtsY [Candidatus Woesearchaeota archaeon]
MFGFLKDKLKSALSVFSKKVEKEVEEEEKKIKKPEKEIKKETKPAKKRKISKKEKTQRKKEEKKKEIIEAKKEIKEEEPKKGFFSRLFSREDKEKEKIEEELEDDEISPEEAAFEEGEEEAEVLEEEPEEEKEETAQEKKGFFTRIKEAVTQTSLSEDKFNDMFWDLEVVLLENNVAVEVVEKIKEDMKETLVRGKISRFNVDESILNTLKKSIDEILSFESADLLKKAKAKRPLVIAFVGVNGSGKTTTIAKVANYFKKNKLSVVLAAADTFRAAAIQQLEEHAARLGVKIIKQDYGADAAAVAFDAIKYAEAHKIDIVLIDTAGRQHARTDLMDEMKKIIRVAKPDYKIFIGESITGNDCVEQAQQFNEAIQIDGIVLSKADVDEKGGAAISVSYVTKKPIIFIGTGQDYDDIETFNKQKIIKSLGL